MTQHKKTTRKEEYEIGSDLFIKEYLPDGNITFYKNESKLDLEAWNKELNKFQSMSVKAEHGNPLVRWLDKHRRFGFLRFVNAQPGDIIADVGCETGYLSVELVNKGCNVICVDIDPQLLEKARERIEPRHATYIASDIHNIQLPDNNVDIALASEILEHLPFPEAGLLELIRITRPGGRIFISVPNEALILRIKGILRKLKMTRLLGQLSDDIAIGHVQVFNKHDLTRLCKVDGVVIKSVRYQLPFGLYIFAHLKRVDH